MRIARAILVILTAFSVAAVPVAGAVARAGSPMTSAAHHEECCPPGEHCDDHAKKDCAKDAACALKCASFSAAPVTSPEIGFTPYSLAGSALIPAIALSLGPSPPSPPPRV
jgi:hypothetical protein